MIVDVSTLGLSPAQPRLLPLRRRYAAEVCDAMGLAVIPMEYENAAPPRRHLIDDLNAAPQLKNGSCEDDEPSH